MAALNAEISDDLKQRFDIATKSRRVSIKAAVSAALEDWLKKEGFPAPVEEASEPSIAVPPELRDLVEEFLFQLQGPSSPKDRIIINGFRDVLQINIDQRKRKKAGKS